MLRLPIILVSKIKFVVEEIGGREESDMRIEAYSQVHQIYQPGKVSKTRQAGGASHTDQLQFSSMGRDIGVAQAAIAAAPDVREELTASIKSQVQNGTYSVDTDTFADKLLKKMEGMR